MAKTTFTPVGVVQLLHQDKAGLFNPADDHLCNAITRMNFLGFTANKVDHRSLLQWQVNGQLDLSSYIMVQ